MGFWKKVEQGISASKQKEEIVNQLTENLIKEVESNEEDLLKDYLKLKKILSDNFVTIPNRPPIGGSTVNPISNEILTQKGWDERYGKFRKFIERKNK